MHYVDYNMCLKFVGFPTLNQLSVIAKQTFKKEFLKMEKKKKKPEYEDSIWNHHPQSEIYSCKIRPMTVNFEPWLWMESYKI